MVQSPWNTVKHGYILVANNSTPEFMVTRRTVTQRQIQLFLTTEKCKQPEFQQNRKIKCGFVCSKISEPDAKCMNVEKFKGTISLNTCTTKN